MARGRNGSRRRQGGAPVDDRAHGEGIIEDFIGGINDVLGTDRKSVMATEEELFLDDASNVYNRGISSQQRARIDDLKSEGQWWVGGLATMENIHWLISIGWFIAFTIFVATNKYNTRLDYNTDFLGTDCIDIDDDDHDVCQEVNLVRVHAVDIHWIFLAMFISLVLVYPMMLISVALLKRMQFLVDDDAFTGGSSNENIAGWGWWVPTTGVLGYITYPMRFLALQTYNGSAFNHNVRHGIVDTLLIPIIFASFGVRDFWKLMFIGAFTLMWNFWLHLAQTDNRRSHLRAALSNASSQITERIAVYWFAPVAQFVMGIFLMCTMITYYAKYPWNSLQWYQSFSVLVIVINIGLRSCFNLFRYFCQDERTNGSGDSRPGQGAGIVANTIYLLAMTGAYIGVACRNAFAVQFVLSLYDVLYLFVPWVFLLGLEGHDNVAQMVFPQLVHMEF